MNRLLAAAVVLASISACGTNNDSSAGEICVSPPMSSPGPNVVAVVVDQGPPNLLNPYTNGLFASVTLCEPGTTNCQIIDHLLVDTGSFGLRVLESELTLALPSAQNANGLALAECLPFVDGSAWGAVKIADIQIGEETASSLRIQAIGEQVYPLPVDCTGSAITDFNTLGANGILGVGVRPNDCGVDCAQTTTAMVNQIYFGCSSAQPGGCTVVAVPEEEQVANPVAAFLTDNNGVSIQLPCVPAGGAPSVPGQLVFGIETQANNGLGGAKVYPLYASGYVGTAFPSGGTQYTSYLDSGSNGLFFLNSQTTAIPLCAGGLKDFYCPKSTANLSATVVGSDGGRAEVNFSVANASRLNASAFAFSNLAGPMPGFPNGAGVPGFDWGLPFFFGRTVFTAIEGRSTPSGGVGPYFAF